MARLVKVLLVDCAMAVTEFAGGAAPVVKPSRLVRAPNALWNWDRLLLTTVEPLMACTPASTMFCTDEPMFAPPMAAPRMLVGAMLASVDCIWATVLLVLAYPAMPLTMASMLASPDVMAGMMVGTVLCGMASVSVSATLIAAHGVVAAIVPVVVAAVVMSAIARPPLLFDVFWLYRA